MNSIRLGFLVGLLMLALLLVWPTNFRRSGDRSPASTLSPQNPAAEASPAQPEPTKPVFAPASPPASSPSPTYRYNAQGQLQAIIYPDGSVYSYNYDTFGDKLGETDRTGKVWSYVYDQNHHPVAVIDPEGRMTHNVVPAATPKAP